MALDKDVFFIVFSQMPVLDFVPGIPLKYWRDGDLAAKLGYKYVIEHNDKLSFIGDRAPIIAMQHGHKEVVKLLIERGHYCHRLVLDAAIERGDVELVRYIHEQCPELTFAPGSIARAADFGHIEVVDYISDCIFTGSYRFDLEYKRNTFMQYKITALRKRVEILEARLRNNA